MSTAGDLHVRVVPDVVPLQQVARAHARCHDAIAQAWRQLASDLDDVRPGGHVELRDSAPAATVARECMTGCGRPVLTGRDTCAHHAKERGNQRERLDMDTLVCEQPGCDRRSEAGTARCRVHATEVPGRAVVDSPQA